MENKIYQNEVDNNYKWFNDNRKKLCRKYKKYLGWYAIIKNKKVIKLAKNEDEALYIAMSIFKDKPYSIQKLEKKETIHTFGYQGLFM